MGLLENYTLSVDTAAPGAGALGPATTQLSAPRLDTYLSIDHNIHSKMDNNFLPTINVARPDNQQYVNTSYVNETYRGQINPTNEEQIALKGNNVWNNLSINDARTTTNETTLYSYAGNAEKTDLGSKFWTYDDAPRVTTNETTLFSYTGDVAPVSNVNQMNRVQFTGEYINKENFGDSTQGKSATSGVTKWSQKSDTLVQNYFPGSNGGANIQQNPDEVLGNTLLHLDNDSLHENGSGTFNQATPNGQSQQQVSTSQIGNVSIPPNRQIGIDDRQTSSYLINNLKDNPLSIYTNNHNGKLPSFFCDQKPADFSSMSSANIKYEKLPKHTKQPGVYSVNNGVHNPNATIVMNTYGQNNDKIENSLLFRQNVPHNDLFFPGKCYNGKPVDSNYKLASDSINSSRFVNRVKI